MALWGPIGGPKWPKTQNLAPWSSFLCILDHFGEVKFLVDLAGLQTPLWCCAPDPPPLWCGAPDPPLVRGTIPPSGAGHQTPPLVRGTIPPLDGHKFDPKVSEASGTPIVLCFGPKKVMRAYRPPSGRPQILTPNAVAQTPPPLVPRNRPPPLVPRNIPPPSGAPHQTPLCRPAYFTQKSQRLQGPT